MKTPLAPALVISLAAVSWSPGSARGQDIGMGWFMPWNTVPSPTNFINDWALQNAARGGQRPPSNNVYANNPNSYVNRVRDNGFVTQYDARGRSPGRRRPASSGSSTSPGQASAASPSRPADAPAPAPAPARTAPSLASFFDAAGRLVWPSDAPVGGELQAKRDVSDQAVSAVRKEVDAQGWAPIALAAEARQKLLDYGRPALQEMREQSSPRIAEAFHGFLMALYDSIAAASIPPAPPVSR